MFYSFQAKRNLHLIVEVTCQLYEWNETPYQETRRFHIPKATLARAVVHPLGVVTETAPDKLLLDVKGHWAEPPASSRLNQLLPSNRSLQQQMPCPEAGVGGCSVWGALGGWDLALVSCGTLVVFSRLRFSLALLDRMKLKASRSDFKRKKLPLHCVGT